MINAKEVKEVKTVLKDLEKVKVTKCPDEKDIENWTTEDLKNYIFIKTKGLSIVKKFKFAQELDKKIKEVRKKRNEKVGK